MSELSFSSRTKQMLAELPIKKGCCKHSFTDATALSAAASEERTEKIKNEVFKCPACLPHYIRGLFIAFGSVTDPAKGHHLEFSFPSDAERDEAAEKLTDFGFEPKKAVRKGKYIAYYKSSEVIEDLLCSIGANSAAFDLMNEKIISAIRGDTNRQVNCDSANINKMISASKRHIDAIKAITDAGIMNELPEYLKEAARIRTEFPEASLADLGMKFDPSISKSGVNHRLEKIVDFAKSKNLI